MHEVHRGAGIGGVPERGADRGDLGLDRPARREIADARPTREMERRGASLDEQAILGVHGDDDAELRGGAVQPEVLLGLLDETRTHHEHLETGVARAHELRQLSDRPRRIVHDDVEGVVGARSLGVALPSLDRAEGRAALRHVDHREHGRDAAGERGRGAVLPVVDRPPRRRRCEMRMQVDASGQHQETGRVDLAVLRRNAPDTRDALALDEHVGALATARRDDGAAADR